MANGKCLVGSIKELNKHIERLESGPRPLIEGYKPQLTRHAWIGELKRKRELLTTELKGHEADKDAEVIASHKTICDMDKRR